MSTPSFLKYHISQIPAIQLLVNMGYTYVTPEQAMTYRNNKTSVVLFEEVMRAQLKKINSITRKGQQYKFLEANINSAIIAIKDLKPLQSIIKND